MRLGGIIFATLLLLISSVVHAGVDSQSTKEPPQVLIKTNQGDIVVALFAEKAPVTVDNFLGYVDSGFYQNTLFHRVIPNFMVQGGGFVAPMSLKKTRSPIKNESNNGLKNDRGTIAMARTNNPDSATSQFYINVVDNHFLDDASGRAQGYTVFGEVVSGMDVAETISRVATGTQYGMQDVPDTAVVIESITRLN